MTLATGVAQTSGSLHLSHRRNISSISGGNPKNETVTAPHFSHVTTPAVTSVCSPLWVSIVGWWIIPLSIARFTPW